MAYHSAVISVPSAALLFQRQLSASPCNKGFHYSLRPTDYRRMAGSFPKYLVSLELTPCGGVFSQPSSFMLPLLPLDRRCVMSFPLTSVARLLGVLQAQHTPLLERPFPFLVCCFSPAIDDVTYESLDPADGHSENEKLGTCYSFPLDQRAFAVHSPVMPDDIFVVSSPNRT
jgi:hypothetical protein